MQIEFNPNLFNEVYWELENIISDSSIRFIWLMGGSSASKTFSMVQLTIKEMLCAPDYNSLVMRKFSTDIKDSIYADFKNIINEWNLNSLFEVQQNYIKCASGSYVRFRGLDDSEKVKGISGFKKVILEEVNQFDEEDFKQIKKRLRGKIGQQIIGIFNPISEQHWIKTNVFDTDTWEDKPTKITNKKINEAGNAVILKTNYTDNIFIVGKWNDKHELIGGYLDQHVVDDFENDKKNDYAYYQIYALGEWGQIITGGEFYKNFRKEKHVAKLEYNPQLPIHVSFDENVNPYFPACLFQIDGKKIMLLDEILARNPNNTVTWICREICRKLHEYNHNAGLFVYGDATSQKDDVKQEKGHDLFRLIMEGLKEFKPQRRVAPSNPSVVMRGNFMNAILGSNYADMQLLINEKCVESIKDFYVTKEASDGRKDKTVVKDKKTGVSYQPHGHCFVGSTLIQTNNGEKRIDEIKIGDVVLTRNGYQKVKKVFCNGLKKVNKYSFGGQTIYCTPNHKILTKEFGFIEAEKIKLLLPTYSVTLCIFAENKIKWKRILSSTTAENLQDTQTQKAIQKSGIIRGGLAIPKKRKGFTFINMKMKLAKFQKAFMFTILTGTHLITTSQICKLLKCQHITKCTWLMKKEKSKVGKHLKTLLNQQPANGINHKTDGSGIKNLCKVELQKQKQKLNARSVKKHLLGMLGLGSILNSVVCNAKQDMGKGFTEPINDTMSKKNVLSAQKNIQLANGLKQNAVTAHVVGNYEKVYDLQIENNHEYFANNILVHNCSDLTEYLICYAFQNEYANYQRGGTSTAFTLGRNVAKNSYK